MIQYVHRQMVLSVTGQRGPNFHRLALRLEALSTQVQRLSRGRDERTHLTRDDLSLLLQRYYTTLCTHANSFRKMQIYRALNLVNVRF